MQIGSAGESASMLQDTTDLIKDSDTKSFAADVLDASKNVPVIVDFWASWCGPCKQLTPLLEDIVKSHKGNVRLVKVDVDKNKTLAAQLRVQSLPTVYAFQDGRPVDGFMGAQPEQTVRAFVDRLIGEKAGVAIEQILAEAQDALNSGQIQMAAEIYATILQEDRENADAIAGLAQCYLQSGDEVRAQQTISLVPPEKQSVPAVQSVIASLALAEKAGQSGPLADLRKVVESDPSNHQARYDLAVALAADGDKLQAVQELLEIVQSDRSWNEDGARKQLIELFEAWGPKDPATVEGRRQLSSVLFS